MPFRLKHGGLTSKLTTECVGRAASLSEMFGKGGGRFIRENLAEPRATEAMVGASS